MCVGGVFLTPIPPFDSRQKKGTYSIYRDTPMNYNKPFQKSEYEQRVSNIKQRMQKAGFDLLICQDPANMAWLTGFDGWSFYTPQVVLVHLEEASPLWFGRAQDAKSAQITTDIPAHNIISFSYPLARLSHQWRADLSLQRDLPRPPIWRKPHRQTDVGSSPP